MHIEPYYLKAFQFYISPVYFVFSHFTYFSPSCQFLLFPCCFKLSNKNELILGGKRSQFLFFIIHERKNTLKSSCPRQILATKKLRMENEHVAKRALICIIPNGHTHQGAFDCIIFPTYKLSKMKNGNHQRITDFALKQSKPNIMWSPSKG